jgi:hypothetical protein
MAEDLVDTLTDTLVAAATATATLIAEAAATGAAEDWLPTDNSSLPLGMDGSDVTPAPSGGGSYFLVSAQRGAQSQRRGGEGVSARGPRRPGSWRARLAGYLVAARDSSGATGVASPSDAWREGARDLGPRHG